MYLLCNAYWTDTYPSQECDLPKIKDVTYGFNQTPDVVATLFLRLKIKFLVEYFL